MVYVGDMAGRTGLGPADVVFGAAVVVKWSRLDFAERCGAV